MGKKKKKGKGNAFLPEHEEENMNIFVFKWRIYLPKHEFFIDIATQLDWYLSGFLLSLFWQKHNS